MRNDPLNLDYPIRIRAVAVAVVLGISSAFYVFPRALGEAEKTVYIIQEEIETIEIPETEQIELPEPPARPSIPIASDEEFSDEDYGTLSIATTHTQAKFTLPKVVDKFVKKYPNVHFQMHQCTPDESVEMAARGEVDIALWTETNEKGENLIKMPCYKWSRSVIVPKGHPLTKLPKIKLKDLANYPIVTYVFGFTGSNDLDRAFFERGLKANVVFTATDADVIKTYVKMGTGVGIIASMAFNEKEDSDLVAINANHLFDSGTTYMGFRRGTYLRSHLFEFINMFAPHLTKDIVAKACSTKSKKELDKVFDSTKLLRR